MSALFAPIAAAVFIWWISTGILLWLMGAGGKARYVTAIILSALTICGTVMAFFIKQDTSLFGAYAGFTLGILLWAWHEAMLLFGYVSGPRKTECPPDLAGWARFKTSAETLIFHEISILLHAVLLLAISVGGANKVAAMTFVLLWGMKLSSKLVIFLGAPNVSAEFLPEHLSYLKSYFKTTRTTRFFPIFLAIITSVTAGLIYYGVTLERGTFEATAYLLLAGLASLAVFEHCALVLRLPDAELWSWARRKPNKTDEPVL